MNEESKGVSYKTNS